MLLLYYFRFIFYFKMGCGASDVAVEKTEIPLPLIKKI